MSATNPIIELSWLPRLESDFKSKELQSVQTIADIALHRLDWMQLPKVAKACTRLSSEQAVAGGLEPVNIWLTGNVTCDFLAPAVTATAPRYKMMANAHVTDFGQIVQPFMSETASADAPNPHIVILYVDILPALRELDPAQSNNEIADAILGQISMATALAEQRFGASVYVTTTPPPLEYLFGSLDASVPNTAHAVIAEYNKTLLSKSLPSAPIPIDMARVAGAVGLANWRDPKLWHKAKQPFAMELNPLVADVIMRTVAAQRGRSRRGLILDLDNTLWGGIVGDDGHENIHIGPETPIGEAFLSIQRYAMQLRQRGIVLAVCSKNEYDNAILPFKHRPEMALQLDDIAVFKANWNDKASNIRQIADQLNLGLASFVFLDDNPVERAQVRQALPDVAVPELTDDPADYVSLLSSAGYFEALAFSNEDRERGDYYNANARRAEVAERFDKLDDFLESLDMHLAATSIAKDTLPRCAELFNKTNQFNLTGKKFSAAEVEQICQSDGMWTLQASLSDKFGDNGIVSTLVIEKSTGRWRIVNWVMSCRVFGRRLEEAILQIIAQEALAENVTELVGEFRASPRNQHVADLFSRLSFMPAPEDEDVQTGETWLLDLNAYVAPKLPFRHEV